MRPDAITGWMLYNERERTGATEKELAARYGLTHHQVRGRIFRYRRDHPGDMRPYGETRGSEGCHMACPHWRRCHWLVRQPGPAERNGVLCTVPAGQVEDVARFVDAALQRAMAAERAGLAPAAGE